MGAYVSDLVGDVDGALGCGDGVQAESWSHGVAEHHGGHGEGGGVGGRRRGSWRENGCEGLGQDDDVEAGQGPRRTVEKGTECAAECAPSVRTTRSSPRLERTDLTLLIP